MLKRSMKKMIYTFATVAICLSASLVIGDVATKAEEPSEVYYDITQTLSGGKYVLKSNYYKLTKDVNTRDCLVVVGKGVTATIDLNGFKLDRGRSVCKDQGSVIRVEAGGELTIVDTSKEQTGVITGGASYNGGGICNHGKLTIEGGTITGNKSVHGTYGNGGGIFNGKYGSDKGGELIIKGGRIVGNTARNGGAIGSDELSGMSITGCEISGNKATNQGGAIIALAPITVTNSKIEGNEAGVEGGAVFLGDKNFDAKFYDGAVIQNNKAPKAGGILVGTRLFAISGYVVINGNNNGNVFLKEGRTILIDDMVSKDSKVGVFAENLDRPITKGWKYYVANEFDDLEFEGMKRMERPESPSDVFVSNVEDYKMSLDTNSEVIFRYSYEDASIAFGKLTSGSYKLESTYYQLQDDYKTEGKIFIPVGVQVIIDLNGHTINRGLKEYISDGYVIENRGGLIIKDTSAEKTGAITGGYGKKGGGINNQGILRIESGSIKGNKADTYGGGIYNEGTLLMMGGTVENNSADEGGGIFSYKETQFRNATIKNNKATSGDGGGLYVSPKKFIGNVFCSMDGNTVFSGNSAKGYGAGLYMDNDEIRIQGTPYIFDNEKDNLFIDYGGILYVTGRLNKETKIGVSVPKHEGKALVKITDGINNSRMQVDDCLNLFVSDDSEKNLGLTSDNELALSNYKLGIGASVKNNNLDIEVSELASAIGIADEYGGCTVKLYKDYEIEESINVLGKNVIIDLNGHSIKRKKVSNPSDSQKNNGEIFRCKKGCNLTIIDSEPLAGEDKQGIRGVLQAGFNGAIYLEEGSKCDVNDVDFLSNSSSKNGGAITVDKATLSLKGCTFENNKAVNGGAISITDGTLECRNTEWKANEASTDGGGIYLDKGNIYMSNCKMEDNKAKNRGGAIKLNKASYLNVQDKVVIGYNIGSGSKDNVFLETVTEDGPLIYSGGMSSGSLVGIKRDTKKLSSGGIKTVVGCRTDAMAGYFKANSGSISVANIGKNTEDLFMATSISSFEIGVFVFIGLELVGAIVVITLAYRKKKRG